MKTLAIIMIFSPLTLSAVVPDPARNARPILSQHCYKCHGPDTQESGLRLDERESALKPAESGKIAIKPGQPGKSELLRRVTSQDPDEVMPPRDGKTTPLSASQIESLRQWIAAGADFQAHWAYVKPQRPKIPQAPRSNLAVANPIDSFVVERLLLAGLSPSPPASLEVLCRRLHFDLIGLPPTPEEVDAFVAAARRDRPSAVETLVDRLLASPRFGEKWARHWLDLARYGDSAGYQHDDDMPMWLYRDWVIRALDADMPFDQFTVEQIAGDLLPGATLEQRIATGFHRCATVTLGADQNVDELRAQLVWDRVNTVGTTWLATSLECAQCHSHKFDPIPQSDYYRMYAYFNRTVPELTKELGSHYFITGGILEMPAPPHRTARVAELKREMEDQIAQMLAAKVRLDGAGSAPLRRIYYDPGIARTPERVYYYLSEELKGAGPKEIAPQIARLRELGRELMKALPPRALVLTEDAHPPATHVLVRGNVRTPGDEVCPGTPLALHALPKGAPANRLGLAQWLVSRDNPLTARVMVNRWWAELFGSGLVSTPEDFGLQGEPPSHPELLDWLAVEFTEDGWSVKRIIKRMVLSATYQRSSSAIAAALRQDPQNRLLGRGPRMRLDAELLRDNALAIAGLLAHKLGGPPVCATRQVAQQAQVDFTWRRGIYLRQQRGEPYLTFANFDAPDRFACVAKRSRTNTPLQALAMLNEPVFAEAAAALATRAGRESNDGDFATRLDRMFRLCTARLPQADERKTLRELFDKTLNDGADEHAAWTLVASVLLNLDETVTKE